MFIGAAFFSAAHERRYRDAFFAQHRIAPAIECARNDVQLIAQGMHDLLNPTPTFKVKRTIDDLAELAAALSAKAPAAVVEPLAAFAAVLGSTADAEGAANAETDWAAVFARINAWVHEAAAFCSAQDPQLDLHGALPNDKRAAQPVVFQRRTPPAVSEHHAYGREAPVRPAADVYEPMYHG